MVMCKLFSITLVEKVTIVDRTSPHSTFPPLVVWTLISAGAWVICADIGQLIGGLLGSVIANPGGLDISQWGQRLTLIIRQMIITTLTSGVILGIGSGLIQAAFLRTYAVPRRRWVISSCIAWTIVTVLDTWRIYTVSSGRWLLAGGLVLAGSAMVVVIFWLSLRHYLPQSWRWALAGVVAYALSAVVAIVQSAIIRASFPS